MFIGFIVSGIFSVVIGLIALGLAGNAVWRAIMPPPGLPRAAGCGSCGYELTTLDAGRCSECGADLLKAGVTTRRNAVRTAGSLAAALAGWTLIAMTVGMVVLYVISIVSMSSQVMGAGSNYTSNFSFRPMTASGAMGTPDFRLRVDVDVIGNFGSSADSGTIVIELEGEDRTARIEFPDAAADGWVMLDNDGVEIARGEDIRSRDILTAFAAVGLDPAEHPSLSDYADRIEILAITALSDPFNYETSLSMSNMNLPPEAGRLQQAGGTSNFGMGNFTPFGSGSITDYIVPLAILGLVGLVWLGGMIFIVRRRARLIEGPRALA